MRGRVLIIYPFTSQSNMVFNLVKNLRLNEVNVDAINSSNFKFSGRTLEPLSVKMRVLIFFFNLPIYKIQGLLLRIVNKHKILLNLMEGYDLIDFHYLSEEYDSLIRKMAAAKKMKVTFWGSDFYRADARRKDQIRDLLKYPEIIQFVTVNMKSDFLEYYMDFDEKIKVANFGLHQLKIISDVQKESFKPTYKVGINKDKLMVVCGYNGSEAQQHSILIESLGNINKELKEKIFLVFPLTYGANKNYLKRIEDELKILNIPFFILRSDLSEKDVAILRIEADLVINIQTSDAFSASLQEHLFCENILLVGEWLPYKTFDLLKIFYCKTHKSNLADNISYCISNFRYLKQKTIGNREKIFDLSSWTNAGARNGNIYKNMLQ